ncbi:MAG TPA: MauE/DoxX family redox-associated membrane protein [Bryobacteraceae bacterium]|nr:MauE/DoxX family redox-associated membrane protein [Bryobacteraceae bacterium]
MKRWLLVIGRLILGVIFAYAAYAKLREPWIEFVGSLAGFQLLPENLLEPIARTLPWFELILGIGLISGVWQRWFSLVASLLLLLFFSVMVRSYAMGLQIDCGCFGPGEALGPKTLARDFTMLALAVAVTIGSFRMKREPEAVPSSPAVA